MSPATSWEALKHPDSPWWDVLAEGRIVASVWNSPMAPERAEADARRIAAVPELLALAHEYAAACSECNGHGQLTGTTVQGEIEDAGPCPDCADIWEVIRKAEGRA